MWHTPAPTVRATFTHTSVYANPPTAVCCTETCTGTHLYSQHLRLQVMSGSDPLSPCFFFRKCCVAFLNRKCSFITSSQKMSHFGNSFRIDVKKNAFKHKKTSRWTTQGAGLWCDYRQMIVILREEWFFFSFRVAFVKRISENKLWNGSLYLFKIICAYYVCYIIVIFLF